MHISCEYGVECLKEEIDDGSYNGFWRTRDRFSRAHEKMTRERNLQVVRFSLMCVNQKLIWFSPMLTLIKIWMNAFAMNYEVCMINICLFCVNVYSFRWKRRKSNSSVLKCTGWKNMFLPYLHSFEISVCRHCALFESACASRIRSIFADIDRGPIASSSTYASQWCAVFWFVNKSMEPTTCAHVGFCFLFSSHFSHVKVSNRGNMIIIELIWLCVCLFVWSFVSYIYLYICRDRMDKFILRIKLVYSS